MDGERKLLTVDDIEDIDLWKEHFENKAAYAGLADCLRDWWAKGQCMRSTIEAQVAEIARLTLALETTQAALDAERAFIQTEAHEFCRPGQMLKP